MSRAGANQGNRRTLKDEYPIVIKNVSGVVIPPFALLGVSGTAGVPINQARVVSVGYPVPGGRLMFNGPIPIRNGRKGRGRAVGPATVLADSASAGTTLGPNAVTPSFTATSAGTGLIAWGSLESGVAIVDFPKAGTATQEPTLRRFQLTANKDQTDPYATAKFLTDAGSMTGSDTPIYDPLNQFAGKIADELHTGQPAFQGMAIQRRDLGAVELDRWEIVAMERCAEFIVVYKYSNDPGVYKYSATMSSFDSDWHIAPAAVDDVMTIEDPASMLTSLPNDTKIVCRLGNPDTSPPTYKVVAVQPTVGNAKRVRGTVVDPGGGFVPHASATFELTSLTEVYGGTPPSAPLTVQQTYAQGYVAGQLTEAIYNEDSGDWENLPLPRKLGCHLSATANGFEYVTPSTLAGPGLGVSVGTGAGGCDQLKAVAPTDPEGEGSVLIRSVTGVTLELGTGGELTVTLEYQTYIVRGSASGGTGELSDEVDIWNKASPGTDPTEVVTSVACVDDAVTGTTDTINTPTLPSEILIPPS